MLDLAEKFPREPINRQKSDQNNTDLCQMSFDYHPATSHCENMSHLVHGCPLSAHSIVLVHIVVGTF